VRWMTASLDTPVSSEAAAKAFWLAVTRHSAAAGAERWSRRLPGEDPQAHPAVRAAEGLACTAKRRATSDRG
jgi:hypothetical protein